MKRPDEQRQESRRPARSVTRSKCEIAIWCLLGAVVGWLLAAIPYLRLFESVPPWRDWPYESPLTCVFLLIGVSGVPVAGLYAARRDRALLSRVIIGAIVGSLLGIWLQPAYSCSRATQIEFLAANPFLEFRGVTCAVLGEQLGSLVAIAVKDLGRRDTKYQYSLGAMLILITECAMLLALGRLVFMAPR